jgi:hypothetical protein
LTEGGQIHRGVAGLFMNRFASGKVRYNRNSLLYNNIWRIPKRFPTWPRKRRKTAKKSNF